MALATDPTEEEEIKVTLPVWCLLDRASLWQLKIENDLALSSPGMLIPYEQYYIQTLHREGKLIPEQNPGEINPLFQTVINPQPPHTTWKDQLRFSLQPRHHSSPTTPNLQHTANQGMYNFRFTILMNTSNTSNYQSTNETRYTQETITITMHKRSQMLISTETHYQLQ